MSAATLSDATVGEVRRRQPALAWAGFVMLVMMVPTLVADAVDERTLAGVSVWLKPLKFQLSTGLYLLTLAWFWPLAPRGFSSTRLGRATVWIAIATAYFEVLWITWRGALGEPSHFATTPFGAVMFALMGVAALALTATSPMLAWAIARRGPSVENTTYRRSVIAGLLVTFVFGAGAGLALGSNGGHWIGDPGTDLAALPVFGWSRVVGDLRVAHFFGLHAMQVLPLVGWWLGRRGGGGWATAAVGTAWVALCAWTFAEALMGRPFLPLVG